jgi:hypothetical protein
LLRADPEVFPSLDADLPILDVMLVLKTHQNEAQIID